MDSMSDLYAETIVLFQFVMMFLFNFLFILLASYYGHNYW